VVTPLADNTRFYWRVRAVNTDDEVGNWSAVWYFRTVILPPTLSTPLDGATAVSRKPVFDWDVPEGPGAITSYIIQVSASPTFGTLLVSSTTVNSAYTPLTSLPANKMLYWRVKANGANGPSLWSPTFDFTTGP
jgi:hypothetical protein